MNKHRRLIPLTFAFGLILLARQNDPSSQERLWQHRNLGKAFYENSTTLLKAVEEFEKALQLAADSPRERLNYGLALLRSGQTEKGIAELKKVQQQAPRIPHTWFNLGIEYKKAQKYQEAIAQLEKLLELAPGEAIAHYNLGVLQRLSRESGKAQQHFLSAARLDPRLAAPHFQLSSLYRRARQTEKSRHHQQIFRDLKKAQQGAAIAEDLEWSIYSEILDDVEAPDFAQASPQPLRFNRQDLPGRAPGPEAGLLVLDRQGDGSPDLLVYSGSGVLLFDGGTRPRADSGLPGAAAVTGAAAGDFNNDGLPDLCLLTPQGAALYRNDQGRFQAHSAPLPDGKYRQAVWLDFDHDYDLDLFLLGEVQVLMRNNGQAGFSNHSSSFPFAAGRAVAAVAFDLAQGMDGTDLAVVYGNRQAVLYKDLLGGHYEARPLAAMPRGARRLLAVDADNDGWTDLASASSAGITLLFNREGRFEARPVPGASGPAMAFADLENRGIADLAASSSIFRNRGRSRMDSARALPGVSSAAAWVAADFNRDGRPDLALLDGDGNLALLTNGLSTPQHWIQVGLEGVRNLKQAFQAEVEVKAGGLYQKKIYRGLPLHFGLGSREVVETVRITWPNGLIQNETNPRPDQAHSFKERQQLSGSCPMVFTWNGQEFEFIGDILGVAPLGASAGEGRFFEADHDEYIQISGHSLQALEGKYEVRITEELREVAYLDQVRLLAVDHPAGLDVYTNDKFKSPPFPEFRLFGVRERLYPIEARDHRGRDVRSKILHKDGRCPDDFKRDLSGLAEKHFIELEFGPGAAVGNQAILVMNGWVDWADGSTIRRASQQSEAGLTPPSLQVQDAAGTWKTVVADMGLPAGKPKTIVVDLSGKFLSASRRLRIITNLCIYWDEIFLGEEAAAPQARLSQVPLQSAELRFRGFSTPVVDAQRKQPEVFDYARWRPLAMWNPTPGLYTRYGQVAELLEGVDDRFVIMAAGDELQLLFDAGRLPKLPHGWKRDFLLYADGWAKDGDLNTAFARSVEPLPFHGMSAYPYPAGEAYPSAEKHRRYRKQYNTRPALRLLQPLRPGPRGRD
ncbi:MAG: FG-GAP-like repeat-containing protein [Acidobacteriota bacterium]